MRKHDRLRLGVCTLFSLALFAAVGALAWESQPLSVEPGAPTSTDRGARPELIGDLAPLPVVAQRESAPRPLAATLPTARRRALDPGLVVSASARGASDLDVVSPRSVALVLELRPTGVTLLERVEKAVPFRVLNGKHGPYTYAIEDAAGAVLFEGRFEVPELCPLQGAEHVDEHRLGHVVLAHTTSVLIRVPHAGAARRVVFTRQLPDLDATPLQLGAVDL